MVTVTQSGSHFYVQNCVDSAIVHELFYNSCNSVIVVRTPSTVERDSFTCVSTCISSPAIYTVKLSELISICSASSTNILFKGNGPVNLRNTFLLENNLKAYNSKQ
jgi:hypothetical protein